jgi:hypothetical protein
MIIINPENNPLAYRGKSWLLRLPLLIFMVYLLYQCLFDPHYYGLIRFVDLNMHEAGHWIFWPLGETLTILGGTLMQLIVPIVCTVAFWRQFDYFGSSFCLVWLGENLISVATYIGDARARVLPLLGGGDSNSHDWYRLLGKWDMLNYDTAIAAMVRFFGIIIMIFAVVWGVRILCLMYKNKINT